MYVFVCLPSFHIGSSFTAKLKILPWYFFLYEKKSNENFSTHLLSNSLFGRWKFYMKQAVRNLQGEREETILTFCEGLYFAPRQNSGTNMLFWNCSWWFLIFFKLAKFLLLTMGISLENAWLTCRFARYGFVSTL